MLERAGQQLGGQVDRDELRLGVDVLVAGHGLSTDDESARRFLWRGVRPIEWQVAYHGHSIGLFLQPR